jgi:hypothetical protein
MTHSNILARREARSTFNMLFAPRSNQTGKSCTVRVWNNAVPTSRSYQNPLPCTRTIGGHRCGPSRRAKHLAFHMSISNDLLIVINSLLEVSTSPDGHCMMASSIYIHLGLLLPPRLLQYVYFFAFVVISRVKRRLYLCRVKWSGQRPAHQVSKNTVTILSVPPTVPL